MCFCSAIKIDIEDLTCMSASAQVSLDLLILYYTGVYLLSNILNELR